MTKPEPWASGEELADDSGSLNAGVTMSHAQRDARMGLLREVMDVTSITASALGRKLRVPVAVVKQWMAGKGLADDSSVAQLEEMLARTRLPPLSAPRLARPALASTVHCGDSRDYVSGLPDESVD